LVLGVEVAVEYHQMGKAAVEEAVVHLLGECIVFLI
jgi:hypothetical protein